jgi:hypothetical protein
MTIGNLRNDGKIAQKCITTVTRIREKRRGLGQVVYSIPDISQCGWLIFLYFSTFWYHFVYVTPIDPINTGFERICSPQPEIGFLDVERFDR